MYVCNSSSFSLSIFTLQSTVVIPLLLWMVLLNLIKTQLRELRYSSDVTQCLFQLREGGECVEQIRDGVLTLQITDVHVSVQYVHDVAMLIKTGVHIIIKLHIN